MSEPDEPLECIDDHGEDGCQGPVEYRMPLSGTGESFPRCEKHWNERLAVQEDIDERYPQMAPADFDPLDAGEAWGEDD